MRYQPRTAVPGGVRLLVASVLACVGALAASACAVTGASGTGSPTAPSGFTVAGSTVAAASGASGAAHVPANLRRALGAGGSDEQSRWHMAELPASLDGDVTLSLPEHPAAGSVGWKMVGAPAAKRHGYTDGALYVTDGYDVVQRVEQHRLREYISVRKRLGSHTWTWQLAAAKPGYRVRVEADGRVALGGGWHIEAPHLLTADGAPIRRAVQWKVAGNTLSLTIDDRGLPLPYTIDPDATPPTLTFMNWVTSGPYTWYDNTADTDRVYYNPNPASCVPASSCRITAQAEAVEDISNVAYVTFPNIFTGGDGGNDTTSAAQAGLVGSYFDNADPGVYPGTNFTGTSFVRTDSQVNASWGAGSPHSGIGTDTFSVQWSGQLLAPETGTYYFQANVDDGVHVDVNGTDVLRNWHDTGGGDTTQCAGGIALTSGSYYPITVEMYDNTGAAGIDLRWRVPSDGAAAPGAGCDTTVPSLDNFSTAGGIPSYTTIPGSNLFTSSTHYSWDYDFAAVATADGTYNMTATNDDGTPDTSANVPFEVILDSTAPAGGSLTALTAGWQTGATQSISFSDGTDAGADIRVRQLERMTGVADGAGGCDFTAGVWVQDGTDNPTSPYTSSLTAGSCYKWRYVEYDRVDNVTYYPGAGGSSFRGRDTAGPSAGGYALFGVVEDTNPACQFESAGTIWLSTDALPATLDCTSGGFTIQVDAADDESGMASLSFPVWAAGVIGGGVDSSPPGPFTSSYTWNAAAANTAWTAVTGTDLVGNSSVSGSVYRARLDNNPPSAGSVVYTNAWLNGVAPYLVTTTASSDGGSGLDTYQLQSRTGTWASGSCTYGGAFADVGAATAAPAVPSYSETGLADTFCAQYQTIVTDHVGNVQTVSSGNVLKVDLTAPTATIDATPPTAPNTAVRGGAVNFTGTSADASSGVATATLQLWTTGGSPVLQATICTDATATPTWNCNGWNSATVPDGSYDLRLNATDVAGNAATNVDTRPITVDNSAPSAPTITFTETAGGQWLYGDTGNVPPKMWYNASLIAPQADFDVDVAASDATSGIRAVAYPDLATAGWTPAGGVDSAAPFSLGYSGATGMSNPPGSHVVTVTNGAGATSTGPFQVDPDGAAPTGYTITPPIVPVFISAATASIPYTVGTDAESGVGSWQLQRQSAALVDGACVGWGAFGDIGAGDGSDANPYVDGVASATCYRYQIRSTDRVGNVGAGYTGSANTVMVDTTAPSSGSISATPVDPFRSIVSLSGGDDDAESNVAQVDVRYTGGPSPDGPACTDGTAPEPGWSCSWDTSLLLDGTYTLHLDLTDSAGNVGVDVDTRVVVVDNSAPSLNFTSITPLTGGASQHVDGPARTVYVNDSQSGSFRVEFGASDPVAGMNDVLFPTLGANWSPAGGSVGAPGPYTYDYTFASGAADTGAVPAFAYDLAGNSVFTNFTVRADGAGPGAVTMSYNNGFTTAPHLVFNEGADALSGLATWQIERRETTISATTCNAGGWSAWTSFLAADQPSPQDDGTVTVGHCYQYRLVATDRVGNSTVTTPTETSKVDSPGISVLVSGGSTDVTEGGATDTYDVILNSEPTANVIVTLTDDAQVDAAPTTLTFTPADFDVAQTVTVTATDDFIHELPTTGLVSHVATSADLDYDGIGIADVNANVADDDAATVTISESLGSTDVTEGGATDTYNVVLTSQPSANVTVDATGDVQAGAAPGSLVFTPADWNVPQAVTVTAVNDAIDEDAHTSTITHAVTSADPDYSGFVLGDVTANISDDDTAGIVATHSGGSTDVAESGTSDTYQVHLASEPTANVTVSVSDDAQIDTGAPVLTFTPGNWNVDQGIVVTGVDDSIDEASPHPGLVSYSIASADGKYSGLPVLPTSADVTDDDTAAVVINDGGSIDIAEAGGSDTYTVVLGTEPTANVTVTPSPDAQQTVAPVSVTFTPADWSIPQTVTVTAVDDSIDELSPHVGAVTHATTSADGVYNGIVTAPVAPNVTDDDTAGMTLVETGGSTDVAESGATDTYTVVLTSAPTSNVVVTPSPDAQVGVAPASVTFTAANWSTPQSLTVSAIDDFYTEASPHPGVVTNAVASADPLYGGYALGSVTANVIDNDIAGVIITEAGGATTPAEGGASDTYTLSLATIPSANVTINLSDDAQVDALPASVTFTPANWNVPQTVTVAAVDDAVDEGAHPGTVSHVGVSGDPGYNGIVISDVVANIADNDTAAVVVTPTLGSTDISEAGVDDTYDVVLGSQPTANVTINVSGDADVTTVPTSLTFTSADWNVPQSVVVSAVDDQIAEALHSGVATHAAVSADLNYSGIGVGTITADITDNDTADVFVTEPGGTSVTEGGAGDTYDVVLGSEPTANVTVNVTPDSQVSRAPAALTFTPANWSVPQSVAAGAVDDLVAEGAHAGSFTHAATSADGMYNGIMVPGVTASITDNDTAAISVVEAGGSTDIAEGGATDTYTVELMTQPTANVTIALSPDAQSTVGAGSLVFTAANWNTPQTVTVTAVDDWLYENAHTSTISMSATSVDSFYNGLPVGPVVAAVTDNDSIGVVVLESGGSSAVSEAGLTDTYTVQLTSQPTANVTINIGVDAQGTVSGPSLVFTTVNWATPQTVTVGAINDSIAEGLHATVITQSATSADPSYNGAPVAAVTASIADNEVAGATIVESGGSTAVAEAGGNDTYTVQLSSQPLANVTVTVSPDAQVTSAPPSLTFTPANWSVAQTVTVTAVNDAVDESSPHPGVVAHTSASADPGYAGVGMSSVTASVTDDDTAAVNIVQSGGTTVVAEGGATDTYDVVLGSQPTANVTINLAPDSQQTPSSGSLTFTPANWNVVQTVTVTAVDDQIDEISPHPGVIAHAAVSVDPGYSGIPVATVTPSITDDDTASITLVEVGGATSVSEAGASDTYTVVLGTQPTANVTVTVTPDAQVSAAPSTLTFTSANWNVAQIVTASAVDDAVDEPSPHNGVFTNATTSADAVYNGMAIPSVTAAITDDDTAAVIVTEAGGSTGVTEGGATDTYTVKLASQPTANVTISVTPDAQTTVSAPSLAFTPANWNVAQTVTVTAVDDPVAEGVHASTIAHAAASADPLYSGAPVGSVVASITDNDIPGIVLTQSGGTTAVTEAGGTDTYTVKLATQPSANVTITVAPDAQATAAPSPLTFTPATWNVAQTVTVGAVNDLVAEGLHPGVVAHTAASADLQYNGLGLGSITANITDNDVAGVTITQAGGTTVSEAGATDTYTLVLTSQPTADVTVNLTDGAQLDAAPTSVTFTSVNWNITQTITVTATDDLVAEGAHTGTITHAPSSLDAVYAGLTLGSVVANITDNDTAGVTVTETGTTDVAEAGGTDTYDVVLTSQPTANVQIATNPNSQMSALPGILTFTPANWNVIQTVTAGAIDDKIDEAAIHAGVIAHTATSTDTKYSGISIASVSANVTDDDTAGVTVVEAGGTNVAEGGATDTYTIVLDSQPTASVTVTVSPDSQVTTAPATVSFTVGNWNVPKTVTVTAVNDLVDEASPHAGLVTHTAASTDPKYAGILIADANPAITDNDVAGTVMVQGGGTTVVTEAGVTDTYTVKLTSQPTANVTINLAPDAQVSVAPLSLTFTTANWNVTQTVTVSAIDDAVRESTPHPGVIAHSATSTDLVYNGLAIAPLTADVTDNDSPDVLITELGGSTDVTEGGATDTYTVVLNTLPTANVTITVTGGAQATALPASLTFTAADWNIPQTVTVTGVDDAVDENAHTGTITHTAASGDIDYNGFAVASVIANVTDNDTAGVTVTQGGGSTDVVEAGANDTFDVVLNSQPTANVTVTVSANSQLTRAPASLVFTPANWNVAQTVTVTAVDDAVDEAAIHPGTVSFAVASPDTKYSGMAVPAVTANVTDNDTAGITMVESAGSTDVTEGSPGDTYTFVLDSQPTANVTITMTGDTQVTRAPASVTFTAANWNVARTVTVTAVNDAIAEGPHTGSVTHAVASGDAKYSSLSPAPVVANITDNDVAGAVIVESLGSTDVIEGGATDTYTVKLSSQPTASVTINLTDDAQVDVLPASLTFTPVNWNVNQSITVTAVNDNTDEGAHTGTVTHAAVSVDPFYSGVPVSNVTANVTDNDIAGATITPSAGTTDVTEGGAGDSYDVVLDSQPTANVTITITPDSQVGAVPPSLLFTPANWNVAQAVAVNAVDDLVYEGAHIGIVSHTSASGDPKYNGVAISDEIVSITDNDTAAVIVTESAGATAVAEAGGADTYDVQLQSQPTAPVTITVSPDAQVTALPTPLVFTAADWNIAQTVTVSAVDDQIDEASPHPGVVTHAATSPDPFYNGIAAASVSAGVTDNDTAGFTIVESGGSTDVLEAGGSDSYSVALTSQPTADVTITVSPDSQVAAAPTTLVFTSINWNVAQSITATAVNDDIDEAAIHAGVFSHLATSADPGYHWLPVAPVTANVTDDDTAGVVVAPVAVNVTEGGATDTYSVSLTSEPVADVDVTLTDDAQIDVSAPMLTFTAANWSVPQVVTVTATNDWVAEGAHAGAVTHAVTSVDPGYNGIPAATVNAAVVDNDTAAITIVEAGGTAVAESGVTDTYTVVLGSQPLANVTVALSPDAQVTSAPSPLTFTAANWNVPQTVTVGAVDDAVDELTPHTGVVTHAAASGDPTYNGFPVANVSAAITDNDTAGVTVAPLSVAVSELGATGIYNVTLQSQPTSNVTITATPDAQTTAGGAVTFTPANWNVAQPITVGAVDDLVNEGPHTGTVTNGGASLDLNYQGIGISSVTANITDNDVPGVTVVETGGATAVAEAGGGDLINIVLDSIPTANVSVTTTPDAQLAVGPGVVTFTPGTWNVPQLVSVAAFNDLIDETSPHVGVLSFTVASADGNYNGLARPNVNVNVTDNDVAGVTVTESAGWSGVTEAGGTDTYDVVLNTQPTANTTVTLTADAQVTGLPSSLTFTSVNWNVPQTITMGAVNDAVAEGAHSGTITHAVTSADPFYNGAAASSVTAAITDDDVAGVLVTESAGSTDVTEGGATDTYDVVLTSQPTADVAVTVAGDAQVDGAPLLLTFTAADWNVPQSVTATAVNDGVAEGVHAGTITNVVTSADPLYNGTPASPVNAAITDNDIPGVYVTESGTTDVFEGGATDSYDVVLGSQPTADVDVAITTDAQVGAAPTPLTFTSVNWNVPQTVTVTAVDDPLIEGAHVGVISHVATSVDPVYNGAPVAGVTANVTDDDVAGVVLLPSGTNDVTEAGAGDSYDVVLSAQPAANVLVTFAPDSQVTTTIPNVTFTPATWNVPQTVGVDAVNDFIAEGLHSGQVAHTTNSLDLAFDSLVVGNASINITDDDVAGVVITDGGSTDVVEAGGPDTFDVQLSSEPVANVTLTLTPDSQVTSGPGSVTFTPLDWNVPQTVTVSAVDDFVAEGLHAGAVAIAPSGLDVVYSALVVPDVAINIADNDNASILVTELGGTTDIAEGGAVDTYDVVLTSQPTADVVITLNSDADATAAPGALTFTSADWAVPQTVTVTAVQDSFYEGSHTGTISHSVASADALYGVMAPSDVVATVTDDDSAGVLVTESGGSTDVAEVGGTDSYDIVLTSEPTADVTVTLSASQVTTTPAVSLTFTGLNWSVPQTISVDAIQDLVAEGAHTGTIMHVLSSADTDYNAMVVPDVTANIADDDIPGVTVTQSGGSTDVTEGGATDSYDVVLDSQPAADVTVTITDDADVDAAPALLTFTSSDWNTPQTVTVTAVNDGAIEGAHVGVVTNTITSADPFYGAMPPSVVNAAVTDNDFAGIVIDTGGGLAPGEPNISDTFTVQLGSQPAADVVVTLTPDGVPGGVDVSGGAYFLTFTAVSWNVPQTVTLDVIDDFVPQGTHPASVNFMTSSLDLSYNSLLIPDELFNVTDDDVPGVNIVQSGGTTDATEGGANDQYDVTLTAEPAANVDVNITTPDGQVIASVPQLTFTNADWNVPQTVTVDAFDDAIAEGAHSGVVSHTTSSTDLQFDALVVIDVTTSITDNDVAGVTVTESGGSTAATEGGTTDTFDVVLTSQPSADVTVTIAGDAQAGAAPNVLTFTTSDWAVPQTVTVTAVNDVIDEALHHAGSISTVVTSGDASYDGAPAADVAVDVTDNDTSGVTITESSLSTAASEDGATDTYTIALTTQPSADVIVTVAPDAQVDANPTPLTFNSGNWSTPQTLTVEAIDDDVEEGPHAGTISHTVASLDVNYAGVAVTDVLVDITDNDTSGVVITETDGSTDLDEAGGSDEYDIALTTEPLDDVTITLTPDVDIDANPVSVTFTPLDWDDPQIIEVTAVDDQLPEGSPHPGTIAHAATSTDPLYDGIDIQDLAANITDNDEATVTVTQSDDVTQVREGDAAGDQLDVVLNGEPTSEVVVFITGDSQVTAEPGSVTFDSTNWDTPQTVTVLAQDDDVVEEDPHVGTLAVTTSSDDDVFDALVVNPVEVQVGDDDTIGTHVTLTGGLNRTKEGDRKGDRIRLRLNSRPTSTVNVSLSGDSQLRVKPALLKFTTSNWNVRQTITAVAIDDADVEGRHSGFVTFAFQSSDVKYEGLVQAREEFKILDNDTDPEAGGGGDSGGSGDTPTSTSDKSSGGGSVKIGGSDSGSSSGTTSTSSGSDAPVNVTATTTPTEDPAPPQRARASKRPRTSTESEEPTIKASPASKKHAQARSLPGWLTKYWWLTFAVPFGLMLGASLLRLGNGGDGASTAARTATARGAGGMASKADRKSTMRAAADRKRALEDQRRQALRDAKERTTESRTKARESKQQQEQRNKIRQAEEKQNRKAAQQNQKQRLKDQKQAQKARAAQQKELKAQAQQRAEDARAKRKPPKK